MPQLYFPLLQTVTFSNFSLFSRQAGTQQSDRSITMRGSPVFCLVGANGIGKTTSLAAIRYGLTGGVPHPDRTFKSVEEFYTTCTAFAPRYFEGRIREHDRTNAAVSIVFQINNSRFNLTRQIFGGIRALSINDVKIPAEDAPGSLDSRYQREIERASGIDFKQFNFLQHVLFNFDDQHRLIFWDEKVQRQLLYLAFGLSPDSANKADSIARRVERAESLMRNAQWQIATARKRLERLSSNALDIRQPDFPSATIQHESYQDDLRERLDRLTFINEKINELNDTIARMMSKQTAASKEYQSKFRTRLSSLISWTYHPVVVNSSGGDSCHLCGSHGTNIQESIANRVLQRECPLCGTPDPHDPNATHTSDDLFRLDTEQREQSTLIMEKSDERLRLLAEQERLEATIERLRAEIASLEMKFPTLGRVDDVGNPDQQLREESDVDIREFLRVKEEQTKVRDESKAELIQLRHEVELGFAKAELQFIPIFRQLAMDFIGMEVQIQLKRRPSGDARLSLSLRGELREADHMLSESQKFFIDIALRMALAEFMSNGKSPTTLFIDTPEGSLDIAYEARAGEMFARFVSERPMSGHIIMTANLNSSKLLLRLAERCRHSLMRIERMTNWVDLSSVQCQEEAAFDEAYKNLDAALQAPTINQ